MELCTKIEDLTCINCIYNHPDEEDDEGTYCYYHYMEPEDCSDRWVAREFFCHEGEWAAKVIVEDYTWEKKDDITEKIMTSREERVKVAGRAQMVACFLNDNVFDWL